jgi:hypothetical protein
LGIISQLKIGYDLPLVEIGVGRIGRFTFSLEHKTDPGDLIKFS